MRNANWSQHGYLWTFLACLWGTFSGATLIPKILEFLLYFKLISNLINPFAWRPRPASLGCTLWVPSHASLANPVRIKLNHIEARFQQPFVFFVIRQWRRSGSSNRTRTHVSENFLPKLSFFYKSNINLWKNSLAIQTSSFSSKVIKFINDSNNSLTAQVDHCNTIPIDKNISSLFDLDFTLKVSTTSTKLQIWIFFKF